jgi:hypothetical protein
MPIFDKSSNSLFETLGRSRQEVLGKKPVIPPPGTLARPGMPKKDDPVAARPPRVSQAAIEKAALELLDVDGDPILVVDDELDVSAITPEEGIADEPPTRILGVRADTAVVFGIGLVLVVAIAYLAGRTTNKTPAQQAALVKPPVEAKIAPPVQAPLVADRPAVEKAADPAPAEPAPPPVAVAKDGNWEMCVVGTGEEKGAKVVSALNDDMMSPIYGKGLTAFFDKKAGQVKIKGFESKDAAILAAIQDMDDPTNGAHGSFKKAYFVRSKKKG